MPTSTLDQATAAAIHSMLDRQSSAWNRGDAQAWSADYSENADFVNIRGQAFTGRNAIMEQHARIFGGPFLGSRSSVSVRCIAEVGPGVVVVESVHEVTSFKFLPPGVAATSEGVLKTLMKYVLRESDGAWQIVAGQNTAVLAGAANC